MAKAGNTTLHKSSCSGESLINVIYSALCKNKDGEFSLIQQEKKITSAGWSNEALKLKRNVHNHSFSVPGFYDELIQHVDPRVKKS